MLGRKGTARIRKTGPKARIDRAGCDIENEGNKGDSKETGAIAMMKGDSVTGTMKRSRSNSKSGKR